MVLIQVQSSLWRVLSGEDIVQFAFLKDHSVSSVENGLEMEKRMEAGITAQRPLQSKRCGWADLKNVLELKLLLDHKGGQKDQWQVVTTSKKV